MDDTPSPGSEIAGYRIESVAGRGGMGTVYRAMDIHLERRVALKVISGEFAEDEEFRRRFKRESRIAASIRHPNVVTVFAAGEQEGLLYIAMDYIEGTDLKAMLAGRSGLDLPLATEIVTQVASALDAAHAKGLVHRDVKPANVLITTANGGHNAYLTDFGLTKDVTSESGMTKTGMFLGTLDYAAPEQIEGGPLDARTDVYALGCMLYEVLTGRVPYPRDSTVATMYAHLEGPPPRVTEAAPGLPAAFDQVVKRAMARRPEDRYPSAGDVARAARAASAGRSISGAEQSVAAGEAATGTATQVRGPRATELSPGESVTAQSPARRRSRTRWLGVAGVAIVAAAVTVLLVLGGGDGSPGPTPLTKDQYQDSVLDVTMPFATRVSEGGQRLPEHIRDSKDGIDAARELTTTRRIADTAIAKLEQLIPPSDVKDLHSRLIQVLKRMRSDVADAGAAAGFTNDSEYQGAVARFSRDAKSLDALAPEFRARGYRRLGTPSGSAGG